MKTKKICLTLFLAAMVCVSASLSAQVTIGSGAEPSRWSLLYLDASEQRKALHNARMTTAERDILVPPVSVAEPRRKAERGLMIFNITNNCLEYWNGERWISLCVGDTPNVTPALSCEQGNFPIPQFAHFNLGGKQFQTARAQMQHAASVTTQTRGSILGGRFQWGRVDMEHAISTDGNFTLWGVGENTISWSSAITYDSNSGQPAGNASTRFITTGTGAMINWYQPTGNEPPQNNLWGNGVDIDVPTTTGILHPTIENQFHQSTSWLLPENDPCRVHLGAGWRVPTQDEWERIGAYDCNPAVAAGEFVVSVNGTVPPAINNISPFTWVPVSCRIGECRPNAPGSWQNNAINGFVIYKTEDWQNTTEAQRAGNLIADDMPEPFLFLPTAGWRINTTGNVHNETLTGWYWSSTAVGNNNARALQFFMDGGVAVNSWVGRANGLSIRCVRD